jgi:hypothetical protein
MPSARSLGVEGPSGFCVWQKHRPSVERHDAMPRKASWRQPLTEQELYGRPDSSCCAPVAPPPAPDGHSRAKHLEHRGRPETTIVDYLYEMRMADRPEACGSLEPPLPCGRILEAQALEVHRLARCQVEPATRRAHEAVSDKLNVSHERQGSSCALGVCKRETDVLLRPNAGHAARFRGVQSEPPPRRAVFSARMNLFVCGF